jgi:phosphoglycerate dehydrogenase-like enzyme
VLVNTGRGSLVDSAALVAALKTGGIAGAALDVFETEPPDPNDELFTLGNVIVTPHAATRTLRVFLDRRWLAARNLVAMINGAPCENVVNPEARVMEDKQ